jgi:uncharacterized RDD family membrane protein YckC
LSHSTAGLWVRVKAFAADYLVISFYIVFLIVISLMLQSIDPEMLQPLFGNAFIAQLSGFALITLPVTFYFALSESSSHQATWGKRWQSILVVQTDGKKMSHMRSLGRTAIKFIPWELAHTCIWQMNPGSDEPGAFILGGFILVWVLVGIYLLTLWLHPKNQALYDKLTGTFVIQNR